MDNSDDLTQELARIGEENRVLRTEMAALRRFLRSLQDLADITFGGNARMDIMDLLDKILHDCLEAVDAKDGSLLVVDQDTSELVFVLSMGDLPHEKLDGVRLQPGQGIAGWVATHAEPAIVDNPHNDQRFYEKLDNTLKFHTNSILAAPIIGAGEVLGVIEILNKDLGKTFTANDLSLLMLVCRFAGELLHNLEEWAAKKASLDNKQ